MEVLEEEESLETFRFLANQVMNAIPTDIIVDAALEELYGTSLDDILTRLKGDSIETRELTEGESLQGELIVRILGHYREDSPKIQITLVPEGKEYLPSGEYRILDLEEWRDCSGEKISGPKILAEILKYEK